VHTLWYIRKNSGFSTQEEHLVLLGLEARTNALGLDHGVGHPLLLLYDVKAPISQNSNEFKTLYHYLSASL
jgi:hypothetical protein